jgi:hypothetical protein
MSPKAILITVLVTVPCAVLLAAQPEEPRGDEEVERPLEQRYDCARCRDTGKVECPLCRVAGDFWCSECGRQNPCEVCHGLGWILCPECGGGDAKAEHDFLLQHRTEQQMLDEAVGTRLRRVETPRFRLITDIDHRRSHQYARLLEEHCRTFNDIFEKQPGENIWEGRCDIYLFQPRQAFVRFAVAVDGKPEVAASGGYSCPPPDGPIVVLFKESRTDDDVIRAIIHELAHLYLDTYYEQGPLPIWVHEGVAQRFEFSYKPETSRREESLGRAKNALTNGTLMPLAELAEMKFRSDELLPYAAAWTAMDCLMTTDRKAFIRWVKLMKDGESQQAAFEQAFGAPLDAANRMWRAHIERLK